MGESMGASIALQSAAADPRIEAVVAEAPFASLREASCDYAALRWSRLLGKTLFAPFSWMPVSRGESLAGFSASGISPEKAVAERSFPVILICDANDVALPCRHAERIYTFEGPQSRKARNYCQLGWASSCSAACSDCVSQSSLKRRTVSRMRTASVALQRPI
jgi:hypothetical protein